MTERPPRIAGTQEEKQLEMRKENSKRGGLGIDLQGDTFHKSPWAHEATGSREQVEGLSETRIGNLPR